MPIDIFLSHLYLSNPSLLRFMETKLTWELSIAWSWMPESEQSNVASLSKSFMASKTFLRMELCTRRASNILVVVLLQVTTKYDINSHNSHTTNSLLTATTFNNNKDKNFRAWTPIHILLLLSDWWTISTVWVRAPKPYEIEIRFSHRYRHCENHSTTWNIVTARHVKLNAVFQDITPWTSSKVKPT